MKPATVTKRSRDVPFKAVLKIDHALLTYFDQPPSRSIEVYNQQNDRSNEDD